jgi:NADH-quinone oxidoreductase subunit C
LNDFPNVVSIKTFERTKRMNNHKERAVKAIEERFKAGTHSYAGETTLILGPEHILEAALALRDEFQYEMMVDETAVDYWPQQEPRFHIIYQLYSFTHNDLLRLRVPLNGNAPHIETMEKVYPGANWKEREIWDMFGIHFDGHSDHRRIIMPYDWQGHPLRKDYPLGYEEVQFTFNAQSVDKRKPYAKD